MAPSAPERSAGRAPNGLLRLFLLFHESQSLGAGTAIARALPALRAYGWTASAWIPGNGALADALGDHARSRHVVERPLAVSASGWREPPGVAARAARTPGYLGELRRVLERERPHVVHANTLLSLPEALVARSLGLPLVVYAHEMPIQGAKRAAAIRVASLTSDVLVGVSNAVSEMLRSNAGWTPVHTVHNGVPIPHERRERARDAFVVGTVGTVSRVKGTDTFLEAARIALADRPSLSFEHVGSPDLHRDAGLDDELRMILASMGSDGRIELLGARPAETVLPGWDVFVLPSRSEGFPLASLEAMALGIPVIATAVGGLPEQIEHLRTGILVRPDDHEALAAWIVRLHDDEALRDRLARAGREWVRSELTIERQAEGMHGAYLTALNRCFGPPSVRRRARPAT